MSGGGSASGGHHHQQGMNPSYRGRGQGHPHTHTYGRGGRHDSSSSVFSSRDGGMVSSSFVSSMGSSSGKKDENRRTLTDFKIVGLEIRDLSWSWGVTPSLKAESIDDVPSVASLGTEQDSSAQIKEETIESSVVSDISSSPLKGDITEAVADKIEDATVTDGVLSTPAAVVSSEPKLLTDMPAPGAIPPPPSRIRIYFHTPVTSDDSHLHSASALTFSGVNAPGEARKGKRKKLEDDDGDLEEGRAPPPPPGDRAMSIDGIDIASVAASAETASEGDWLMAAIGEVEGEGEGESHADLHVSEIGARVDEAEGPYAPETEEYGKSCSVLFCLKLLVWTSTSCHYTSHLRCGSTLLTFWFSL